MVHDLGLGEAVFGLVVEEVRSVFFQVLDILPDVHHGVVEIVIDGEGVFRPPFFQFIAAGEGRFLLETRALLVDEVLVAKGHGFETAPGAEVLDGLRLLERVAVCIQPDGIYSKVGFVFYAGSLSPFLHAPELRAEPVRQEGDDVVRSDGPGKLAGVSVKKETVSNGDGVPEEEVHLHVAVAAQRGFIDGLVRLGDDGHGEVESTQGKAPDVAHPGERAADRKHENLVLYLAQLHRGDGNAEGVGLLYIDIPLFVFGLVRSVHLPEIFLRENELLRVVHREGLDEHHRETGIG